MAERGKRLGEFNKDILPIIDDEFDKLFGGLGNENILQGTLYSNRLKKANLTATVGASEVSVLHGLGVTPSEVIITMTSTGMIWESTDPDTTKIYLTADGAGRTCKVTCIA